MKKVIWLDKRIAPSDGPGRCCTVAVLYHRSILPLLISNFDPSNPTALHKGYRGKLKRNPERFMMKAQKCMTDWYLGNVVKYHDIGARSVPLVAHLNTADSGVEGKWDPVVGDGFLCAYAPKIPHDVPQEVPQETAKKEGTDDLRITRIGSTDGMVHLQELITHLSDLPQCQGGTIPERTYEARRLIQTWEILSRSLVYCDHRQVPWLYIILDGASHPPNRHLANLKEMVSSDSRSRTFFIKGKAGIHDSFLLHTSLVRRLVTVLDPKNILKAYTESDKSYPCGNSGPYRFHNHLGRALHDVKTQGFETTKKAMSVCPEGTGKAASLTVLQGLGVSHGSVFEDGTWGRVISKCPKGVTFMDNEPDPWDVSTGYEDQECVIVPSKGLFFSLVWKAGSRSLIEFIKCAAPDAEINTGPENTHKCRKASKGLKHIAVVREDIFERYFSGYKEILFRVWRGRQLVKASGAKNERKRAASTKASAYFSSDVSSFERFVEYTDCLPAKRKWAHLASQSYFLRKRPVDILVKTESMETVIGQLLGYTYHESTDCTMKTKNAGKGHQKKSELGISKTQFNDLLAANLNGIRDRLCRRYMQDIYCLGLLQHDRVKNFCADLHAQAHV